MTSAATRTQAFGFRGARLACVVAHPDDETLGCGGLIARAADEGAHVKVLLPLMRKAGPERADWATVTRQFVNAVTLLGGEPVLVQDAPCESSIRSAQQLMPLVEPMIAWADWVVTHWRGDLHHTHRVVSEAVEVLCRPFRRHRVLMQFEVPSATDQGGPAVFAPNFHVTLGLDHLQRKMRALTEYREELDWARNPEHLAALALIRGGQIGRKYAEAFYLTRAYGDLPLDDQRRL